MATAFDRVDFIHRLEETGLARKQAEAISSGIMDAARNHVTNEQLELALSKSENRMTARVGVMIGASTMALMVAVIASLISLSN